VIKTSGFAYTYPGGMPYFLLGEKNSTSFIFQDCYNFRATPFIDYYSRYQCEFIEKVMEGNRTLIRRRFTICFPK